MASFRFKSFMLLVTLFGIYARIGSSTGLSCPDESWRPYQPTGGNGEIVKCFKIFDKMSYQAAKSRCHDESGTVGQYQTDLASISLKPEEELLLDVYIDYINEHQEETPPEHFWIGLNPVVQGGNARETDFEWFGNSQYEPQTRTGRKAVARFVPAGIDLTDLVENYPPNTPKYVLVDASLELPFVCERPPTV